MENIKYFGTTPSGEDVYCICLQNEKAACEVISYGASLKNLLIPDRNGNPVDVVLGYDTLEQYLADKGIQTIIHYPTPPHKQLAYAEWNECSYPITEKIHREIISLPISPVMTQEEAEYVAAVVNAWK